MTLALSWPKQLTYPLSRCSVPERLNHPKERARFFDTILSEGCYVAACAKLKMARGSVWQYRRKNPDFEEELQSVFEELYHNLGFEAIKLADAARAEGNPAMSALVRNQIDARLRVRGYHKPQNVQVNVDNRQLTVAVNDPERAKLIEARNRALEQAEQKQ